MLAVAFLRAVNVGGTGKLAMAGLKALAEEIDLGEPRTLLQSGNLVFDAKGKAPAQLESLLASEIKKRSGIDATVMVHNGAALKAVIALGLLGERISRDHGFL